MYGVYRQTHWWHRKERKAKFVITNSAHDIRKYVKKLCIIKAIGAFEYVISRCKLSNSSTYKRNIVRALSPNKTLAEQLCVVNINSAEIEFIYFFKYKVSQTSCAICGSTHLIHSCFQLLPLSLIQSISRYVFFSFTVLRALNSFLLEAIVKFFVTHWTILEIVLKPNKIWNWNLIQWLLHWLLLPLPWL